MDFEHTDLGVMTMYLETPRLCLYPLTPEQLKQAKRDLAGTVRFFQADVEPVRFWEMWEKRRIYAAKSRMTRQYPNAWLLTTAWLVVSKSGRLMVAEAGFKGPPGERGSLEIGYSTRKKYQNQGFMTEAVGALCHFAFTQKEYKIRRIYAYTLPDNAASQRVLTNNGFVRASHPGKYWLFEKIFQN
jgi:RimJ/RimL family protein N-acetyltransferase